MRLARPSRPNCRPALQALHLSRRQGGYSLIEVLVSMVVTAIGLMGVGFLVTFAIQRTQSSEQLGVATDYAQQGLDLMRANRLGAFRMTGANQSQATACAVAEGATLSPEQRRRRWDCAFTRALPGATANWTYANGVARVAITWNRDRGEAGATADTLAFETRL